MLNQMVKCVLYLSYYYNDNLLMKYFNSDISLSDTAFLQRQSCRQTGGPGAVFCYWEGPGRSRSGPAAAAHNLIAQTMPCRYN